MGLLEDLSNMNKVNQMTDWMKNPHDNSRPSWMASPSEIEKRINSLPPGFDRDPKYNQNFSSGNGK
jgi:hypothetical protein